MNPLQSLPEIRSDPPPENVQRGTGNGERLERINDPMHVQRMSVSVADVRYPTNTVIADRTVTEVRA